MYDVSLRLHLKTHFGAGNSRETHGPSHQSRRINFEGTDTQRFEWGVTTLPLANYTSRGQRSSTTLSGGTEDYFA